MKKVLAILGDFYHPYEWVKASLTKAVSLMDEEVDLIEVKVDELMDQLATQPDAVILFKEDRVNPQDEQIYTWMTEEVEAAIAQYVADGGGWLAWHSGLASYSTEGKYTQMLKGSFEYHPVLHQLVQYKSTKGAFVEDVNFEIRDEHYFVRCNTEETSVFLTSESVDGKSIAGWSHRFGEGCVCCLTPAHNQEELLHPEFLRVLEKSISLVLSE